MGKRLFEVEEILDQWLAPSHRYFKLKTTSGEVFILRHETEEEFWEITTYNRSEKV